MILKTITETEAETSIERKIDVSDLRMFLTPLKSFNEWLTDDDGS